MLLFAQDNGLTREEFMWFMNSAPAGFQVMGNDYYGHNEKLLLPGDVYVPLSTSTVQVYLNAGSWCSITTVPPFGLG